MRAFYYLFILFNNLLSIHIHKCGENWGGGLAPKPLMSAAYGQRSVLSPFHFNPYQSFLSRPLTPVSRLLLHIFLYSSHHLHYNISNSCPTLKITKHRFHYSNTRLQAYGNNKQKCNLLNDQHNVYAILYSRHTNLATISACLLLLVMGPTNTRYALTQLNFNRSNKIA